ncbi:MAG: extracellular solute-binding protein [Candidatus Cloacimonetes bacterium]|nr:extracellular solute-binding protein [Candidatus Cloacimonadota bacterium]
MAGNIAKSNDLKLGNNLLLKIVTIFSIVFLISPLLILVFYSFNSSRTISQWQGFSFKWYFSIFNDRSIWFALKNSLIIAVISTFFTTILGTAAALAVGKYAFKGKKLFENILYIPIILPEIIFGISLLALFMMIKFPLGMLSIIAAHITFSFSFVTLIVLAKVNNFDKNLEEASLDMGANRWQTFRYVILPNIAPGIISGALFAFTLSIDDFVVTFFTAGVGSSTLPLKIYSLIKYGITPGTNAISSILIFFTIAVLLIVNKASKTKVTKKSYNYAFIIIGGALLLFALYSFFSGDNKQEQLNIYNYSDYMDEELIKEFEEQYNIKVNVDYMNDSEELLSRLLMGVAGYDIIVPTSYTVKIMIENDLLSPIDFSNIPNYANVDSAFTKLSFDPTGTFYVPYCYGITALVYNSEVVKEPVDSWQIMWNSDYKGRILMIDDIRDTFFAAYRRLDLDFDSNTNSLQKALELLLKQKPLLKKYESNMTFEYLINKDVYLAHTWNGAIARLNKEYPQFKMGLPKEGVSYFVDNLCIPKTAVNKKNAELFINFLYTPENAARNMNKIYYTMPVPEAMNYLNDDLKGNKIFNPFDEKDMPPMFITEDLGEFAGELNKAWTILKTR